MTEALTPAMLSQEGAVLYKAGRYVEAAALYEQAAKAHAAAGDVPAAAEMANNRSVALLKAGDASGAFQAAEGTDRVFAETNDPRRQGMALANQAAALDALNRGQEALQCYQRAADLLKQSGDKELRAMVLQSISALQLRTGSQLQALASMDASLDNRSKLSLKERFLKKLLKIPLDMMKRK